MTDIRHRVGIAVPPARVFEQLATVDGVSGWWTRDVAGDSHVGAKLSFFFGRPEPSAVMEVVDIVPNKHVRWLCIEGPDEWVGTTLSFDLTTSSDETALLFTHANWREPVEFMHHCGTKWAYFLLGLKAGLEGGHATPFPDDMKISSWG